MIFLFLSIHLVVHKSINNFPLNSFDLALTLSFHTKRARAVPSDSTSSFSGAKVAIPHAQAKSGWVKKRLPESKRKTKKLRIIFIETILILNH